MVSKNVFWAVALVGSTLGCNVFDESLIPEAGGAGGTSGSAGASGSAGTGTLSAALGEDCLGTDIPKFDSLNDFRVIDTGPLKNDRYELSCVGTSALGNDGFFSVDMLAGKKWHFHVKVTPGSPLDPAVYVLDSGCQDSVCQRGWGLNECVSGQDEHFSFFPPSDGTYLIGVDSVAAGGESLQVLAVQPACGNGMKEHSETCEDGNLAGGDGCDDRCRAEIADGTAEKEPNDEPVANANVLSFGADGAHATGQVGGKCDFDSYAFSVAGGESLSVTISGSGGGACSLAMRLQLIGPDGLTPLATIDTPSGTCPAIVGTEPFASAITQGLYFVRLTTQVENEPAAFDYALELKLTAP